MFDKHFMRPNGEVSRSSSSENSFRNCFSGLTRIHNSPLVRHLAKKVFVTFSAVELEDMFQLLFTQLVSQVTPRHYQIYQNAHTSSSILVIISRALQSSPT